jgi:hypothetical protein
MLRPGEVVVHAGNAHEYTVDVAVGGEHKARGLAPRNYATHPVGCYATLPALGVDFPLIPESEWSERLKDKIAQKSLLSDLRLAGDGGKPIPSRDQNGKGYCWMHSGVSAMLLHRCASNQPYADLSAYAGACIIKSYRDEGGWGAEGCDFLAQRGIPTAQFWPQRSMSRDNDKPETWADAAKHKITAGWWDVGTDQYDRKLTWQQLATLWLSDCPTVNDYNWWSHSVCGADLVEGASTWGKLRADSGKRLTRKAFDLIWGMDSDEAGAGWGCRILNSWGDSWSAMGMGVLAAGKAVPDGSVAIKAATVSE